jgi:hypothetical protein
VANVDQSGHNMADPPKEKFIGSGDFWYIIVAGLVVLAVFALSAWIGADPSQRLLHVLLTILFGVLVRIAAALIGPKSLVPARLGSIHEVISHTQRDVAHLVRQASAQPELLTDIESALERARSMHDSADILIDAVWGAFPPGKVLDNYFEITLAKDIFTRRIISIGKSNTVEVILKHIRDHWARLVSKKYKIFITRPLPYEMLIVDNEEAAYFHFPGGGIAGIFIRSNDNRFVNGVRSEWDGLLEDASEFLATEFGENFDEVTIRQWLQERADAYT